jgi:hypothetical protein
MIKINRDTATRALAYLNETEADLSDLEIEWQLLQQFESELIKELKHAICIISKTKIPYMILIEVSP